MVIAGVLAIQTGLTPEETVSAARAAADERGRRIESATNQAEGEGC
jgi:hypothetical protein|tara:strand:+ start:265 stop:402 length:138 start_codon:yes stop_codon:yes gene_type:complete